MRAGLATAGHAGNPLADHAILEDRTGKDLCPDRAASPAAFAGSQELAAVDTIGRVAVVGHLDGRLDHLLELVLLVPGQAVRRALLRREHLAPADLVEPAGLLNRRVSPAVARLRADAGPAGFPS